MNLQDLIEAREQTKRTLLMFQSLRKEKLFLCYETPDGSLSKLFVMPFIPVQERVIILRRDLEALNDQITMLVKQQEKTDESV